MKTILVVDDEFGIAEFLTALLTDEGYRVIAAANGKQALDQIAEQKPDLVLLDFMMPVMNGASVLNTLTADPKTRDIPIVLMSALREFTISDECHGYAAFLQKPFKIPQMLELIARLIGKGETTD